MRADYQPGEWEIGLCAEDFGRCLGSSDLAERGDSPAGAARQTWGEERHCANRRRYDEPCVMRAESERCMVGRDDRILPAAIWS